jgi:hypothetical protein
MSGRESLFHTRVMLVETEFMIGSVKALLYPMAHHPDERRQRPENGHGPIFGWSFATSS